LAVASTLFSILGPKIMGKATTKLAEGIMAKYAYYIQLNTAIEKKMPIAVINKLRNEAIPSFDFGYIGKILILMIGLYIISAAFTYIMAYIMASVSQQTVYRMRNEVKYKLDRLPLIFRSTYPWRNS
jgi:ATP-binding cassette subfamily B protein